jgi:BMFP domain-containing protein YqiC
MKIIDPSKGPRTMTERPKFFDDLAGVAGGALSALSGLREEITSLVRARVEEAVRKLDLVKREEFEALAEVAARARMHAEALEQRVSALEARGAAPEAVAPAEPPAEEPPTLPEPPPVAGGETASL